MIRINKEFSIIAGYKMSTGKTINDILHIKELNREKGIHFNNNKNLKCPTKYKIHTLKTIKDRKKTKEDPTNSDSPFLNRKTIFLKYQSFQVN
jgi:hypothetical protein